MHGSDVGGLMAMPEAARRNGMRPSWYGYVSVADVDACVARIVAAGGEPWMPATDIPGVGRIAMIRDPQGAAIYVMQPAGEGKSTAFAPALVGHCGWNELHTRDWAAALEFYRGEFGWHQVSAMDMGPLGIYLMFGLGTGDAVGGMVSDSRSPRPHWLYYFNVEDIDVAHSRVSAYGGEVVMDPHQVPTGQWIVHARDPLGAWFALVGPRRQSLPATPS
jgi:predicted enzyme related to lactoylglutathione lyase